jgi:ATP-dependent DNA helicase RecG
MTPLALAIKDIKGIGTKSAEALSLHGLKTIFDLLLRVPKTIVEEEESPGLLYLEAGRVYVIRAIVHDIKITNKFKKRLEAIVYDDTGRMQVVFFGPAIHYAAAYFNKGSEVVLVGEAKNFMGRIHMVHPKIKNLAEPLVALNQATYSQIAGINSRIFKNIVEKALVLINSYKVEHLPEAILTKLNIKTLSEALFAIHKPEKKQAHWDKRGSCPFFNRLAFEELLSFYMNLYLERSHEKKLSAQAIQVTTSFDQLSINMPFKLTTAQERVIEEIIPDMSFNKPMTRLLQGDVGSGKTAVSAYVSAYVVKAGFQVAVMAPTEILAEQLFITYKKYLGTDISIASLSSATKTKQRKDIINKIISGEIDIIIGTHVLLSDDIKFKHLALSIVDEQHRFGVKQRAALLSSCEERQGFSPHLLVMSATPIPRSLALTLYGDLDISIIDERPAGRKPIITKILSGPIRELLNRLGERIILSQQKAFIIFPLVEESEHIDLENATKAYTLLKERFGEQSSLLLHGRLKAEEKQRIMEQFRHNPIPFLVSTTVVEVGIDIPDASCMVIAHAERFGLAQLHQLRGRVGRGDKPSFCFLLTTHHNKQSSTYERLSALAQSENGFELARIDLNIRGPGEILGTKQAGMPNFLIFNHQDFAHLVEPAKNYAKDIAFSLKTKPHADIGHLVATKEFYFS